MRVRGGAQAARALDHADKAATATGGAKAAKDGSQAEDTFERVQAGTGVVASAADLATLAARSPVGRAAARVTPGLNTAVAALDVANFGRTMADPKASVGQKITSGITAAGSTVAATNIPVASQVGGVVSTASDLAGGYFFSK